MPTFSNVLLFCPPLSLLPGPAPLVKYLGWMLHFIVTALLSWCRHVSDWTFRWGSKINLWTLSCLNYMQRIKRMFLPQLWTLLHCWIPFFSCLTFTMALRLFVCKCCIKSDWIFFPCKSRVSGFFALFVLPPHVLGNASSTLLSHLS
jgi:hypothetical protein